MVRVLPARPERARAGGFLVFLAFVLLACFPYAEATRNANELPRLVQGMAIWETGHFAIDGPVRRRIDVGPDVSRSPLDGRLYPNKPPGTSLGCAAAYAVARAAHGDDLTLRQYTWWARFLTGVLPTWGLVAFMLGRLARAFGRAAAIAGVSLYVLATPAYAYAHLAYGHALAACLLVVGVIGVLEQVELGRSWWRAAGFGAMAGSAVGVEYGAVFGGLPLAVYLVVALRRRDARPAVVGAVVGSLVPIAALALYHEHAFGSPWATGYHHVIDAGFAEKHGQGLLGLGRPSWDGAWTHLFSPRNGLLWWVPLLPAGLWGLAVASTHRDQPVRAHARVLLGIIVLYLLVTCSLSFEGGWRIGPRYVLVALPALAWGFAEFMTQIHHRARWIVLVVGLATYGLVIHAWAANMWPHIDDRNLHHPVAEVLWPLWKHHVEPYGLRSLWGNVDGLRPTVVLSVVGGLLAIAHAIEPMPRTIAAGIAGVLFGGIMVWAVLKWPPHERGPANLAYIERVWEPRGGMDSPSLVLAPLGPETLERARRGPVRR